MSASADLALQDHHELLLKFAAKGAKVSLAVVVSAQGDYVRDASRAVSCQGNDVVHLNLGRSVIAQEGSFVAVLAMSVRSTCNRCTHLLVALVTGARHDDARGQI